MIDLDKAKKEFEKYVKPYDIQNAKISRKIAHSYRVVEVSEQIAKSLNLGSNLIPIIVSKAKTIKLPILAK